MPDIPDFITHYYRPDREPFQNLSDVAPGELAEVLAELERRSTNGRSSRRFGPVYMELRRATEELLRSRFISAGGRPERRARHYFVLGESRWFRGLYREVREVRIPLTAIAPEHVSFTYPDSVTSMGLLPKYGIEVAHRPYHGRVFRIDHLAEVIEQYGMPNDVPPTSYEGHQQDPSFEHYIEVQLWADQFRTPPHTF